MPFGGRYKNQSKAAVRKRKAAFKKRASMPGFYQTSGYYGRYNTGAGGTGGELKFFDTTATFATVAAAGEINASLNLVPQGVTESDRIGRKMTIKRLDITGDIIMGPLAGSATGSFDRVRVIVYLDKQANGATAAVTDILETADILSYRNLANSGRFVVLSDKIQNMVLTAGGGDVGGADSNFPAVIKTYKMGKSCNIPVEFSATTGAITEVRSNNIGMLAIAETNLVSAFKFNARIRFSG